MAAPLRKKSRKASALWSSYTLAAGSFAAHDLGENVVPIVVAVEAHGCGFAVRTSVLSSQCPIKSERRGGKRDGP